MPMRGPTAISTFSARGRSRNGDEFEREAVVCDGDAERLAQASGAGAQEPLVIEAAAAAHGGEAARGYEGANEDGARRSLRLAYEVEAPVDAVGAVDIGEPRCAEHHRVARGTAAVGMRGRIGVMVGLDLRDDAARALEQQRGADQVGRDRVHAAREEAPVDELGHRAPVPPDGSRRWGRGRRSIIFMRIFLAGATGAIGRRLVPLLVGAGHTVTGSTRSPARAAELERAGARPAVVDVYDAPALTAAVVAAAPDVVIHQLTDLPQEADATKIAASYTKNARIRTEGTRNLIAAASAAGTRRLIVQSIAFAYAPGGEPHSETAPLNLADPARAVTVKGAAEMERLALAAPGMESVVLRYGLLYGPGTWSQGPARAPGLHVDAAAQAALLALTRGAGIYNIADDDGVVSIAKARAELAFDPDFRLP